MFFGRERLAISMILGVLGMFSEILYVTVSIAEPNKAKNDNNEFREKVGTPITPEFYRPIKAIWEPSPTSAPDRMRRRVDIFLRYTSSSKGK